MNRRAFLGGAGLAAAATLSGCQGLFETESVWSGAPLVEDRPDAVYLPASTEEMGSYGTRTLPDGAELSLHYTFPHRFWLVTGSERERVEVESADVMHLMASVWDPETGIVLPRQPRATLLRDGSAVDSYQVWAMLAQRMGYHFGNNVALPEEDEYEVRIDLDPVTVRTAGSLADRFGAAETATVPIEFDRDDVLDLSVSELPRDQRGERGALESMEMGPPPGRVPAAEELPGTHLGSPTSADAVLAGTLLDAPPTGVDGDGPYLAVSARTPYNRIVLPGCAMAATVDGEQYRLVETVDDRLGHHYGAALESVPSAGPQVEVETPPQVARHDGYETAFFDFEPVTLDPPGG